MSAPTVRVEEDEESVGRALCAILEAECASALASRGSFSFAISGGSMLKMLSNLGGESVVASDKCTMAFVSHRCVPLDDDGATYHKARPKFLDAWMQQGLKVVVPSGSDDAEKEAAGYEAALLALPQDANGRPAFDLLLIGIGLDGHVGSIYPNIPDVDSQRVVVPITGVDGMGKLSTKISLSLATMQAARMSVVACAGKSAKAPLGKAQAMVRALEAAETPMSFPASALRHSATWLIDADSAVLLGGTGR
ncbi:glucosamine-6-phosphate isomerases/6-phosphogluconolactonase-domain-containing protein [Baffinella frigidus]|nr:glucosamine-6-phosphate isomerases/6-phosphogluconolactonase-domain-containing protein [Cryptophyta sp. CCMP2293]